MSKVTVKKEFMDELSQLELENKDPETVKIEPIKKIKIKELLSQNSKLAGTYKQKSKFLDCAKQSLKSVSIHLPKTKF